jgi:hypothetical protein
MVFLLKKPSRARRERFKEIISMVQSKFNWPGRIAARLLGAAGLLVGRN